MALPHFLGIGVPRAATTWLHTCLDEHPEVFVPAKKELHFFNRNFEYGLAWYESHFSDADPNATIGEITPNYLHTASMDRIIATLPDARVFLVLRDPVSRARSAYDLHREQYRDLSFKVAFETTDYLRAQSLYADRLEDLLSHFDRHKVKILLYEDIIQHPTIVLRELFHFLEVDESCMPETSNKTYNKVIFPRTQEFLQKTGLSWSIDAVKATPVGEFIKRRFASRPPRGHDDEHFREFFREDICRVQQLINRDLSFWL